MSLNGFLIKLDDGYGHSKAGSQEPADQCVMDLVTGINSTYSTAAKGCFWEMTPIGSLTRYNLFFLIKDTMGYVESVVVEKLIWSRI